MATEQLLNDISARLQAIGESVSEERIRALVNNALTEALKGGEAGFVRKLQFGGNAGLRGSRFSRWGLTAEDIGFAHEWLTAARATGRSAGPSQELVNAFTELEAGEYMSTDEPKNARTLQRGVGKRAMDTAESGYGNQIVGAQYVGTLWEGARREARIAPLLNTFEMLHPTAYVPVEADIPEMLYVSESTASNSSNYTTSKTGSNRVTVSAAKFVIHQMWSGELNEDSFLPFVPYLRRQSEFSMGHYMDSLILNGDTTNAGTGNINSDDADPADTKHYLAFDGIRHAGIVDNTANKASLGGAISASAISAISGRMIDDTYLMDWGHPRVAEDLVHVTDPRTADAIRLLDEVLTVDKYGPQATILTGELGRIFGHPIITSQAMTRYDTDGKYTTTSPTTNSVYGSIASFNVNGVVLGWRRRVQVEMERVIGTDQMRVVYSMRAGLGRFSPTGAASGIEWADVLYNITL